VTIHIVINGSAAAELKSLAAQEAASPIAALQRFASGRPLPSDVAWMCKGVSGYVNCAGLVPLERCLQLPRTPNSRRIDLRNNWLREVARLLDRDKKWAGCAEIEVRWTAFVTRGNWRLWRDQAAPPIEIDDIEKALFYATRHNKGRVLNHRQIVRVCGHVFNSKSP